MSSYLKLCIFSLLFFCSATSVGWADQDSLERIIDEIAEKTHSVMGVTAIHIESNKKVSYNGTEPFFMASTVKIPIAITLLQNIEQNQTSLDRVLRLTANQSVPGSGNLQFTLNHRPMYISVGQLLKLMLVISDNSASDAILREVNGPASVAVRMQNLGLNHINVSRSLIETLVDANGANPQLLTQTHTSTRLEKALGRVPFPLKMDAWRRFQSDLRDTTTSDDMATLLTRLYRGELLSEPNTAFLLHIMEHCKTGRTRMKRLLPPYTKVAHKTGTWAINAINFLRYPPSKQLYRFASDVGIITLPAGRGHLVLAVYVKSKSVSDRNRSRAIALVSRRLYDYFAESRP